MKINRINLLLFLLFSCHYIDYDPGGEAPPKGRITLEADYQDLVASELSFADFTENNNIRDGFLAFMADEGIIYRGEFVNAKAYYEPLPPTSTVLSWRPEVAGISRSGDLGYTTGPYESRPGPGADPSGLGHYISLWQKVGDGEQWKVVFDIGSGYREQASFPAFEFPSDYPLKIALQTDTSEVLRQLFALEEAFSNVSSRESLGQAYRRFLADETRIFRAPALPYDTPAKVAELVRTSTQSVSIAPAAGKVSQVGDMGYTYGFASLKNGSTRPYLHIWKREGYQGWKIVIEVLPVP